MRKRNTNKTQILHRVCLGNQTTEKPPEDNCQRAERQIDDISMILLDDLYTLA